jgi:hypothetical protein
MLGCGNSNQHWADFTNIMVAISYTSDLIMRNLIWAIEGEQSRSLLLKL